MVCFVPRKCHKKDLQRVPSGFQSTKWIQMEVFGPRQEAHFGRGSTIPGRVGMPRAILHNIAIATG